MTTATQARPASNGTGPTVGPTPWEKLREPFPPEKIGKLPKPTKKDNPKGKCGECGGWHGLPAIHLDYVSHADVTDRLLSVDPAWNWEPVAFGDDGLPRMVMQNGRPVGLWIRLTVRDVTRLGYGSVDAGAFDAEKQLIGDALRNAAMRFGVGLDMWRKDESRSHEDRDDAPRPATPRTAPVDRQRTAAPPSGSQRDEAAPNPLWRMTIELLKRFKDGDQDEVGEVYAAFDIQWPRTEAAAMSTIRNLGPEKGQALHRKLAEFLDGARPAQPPADPGGQLAPFDDPTEIPL